MGNSFIRAESRRSEWASESKNEEKKNNMTEHSHRTIKRSWKCHRIRKNYDFSLCVLCAMCIHARQMARIRERQRHLFHFLAYTWFALILTSLFLTLFSNSLTLFRLSFVHHSVKNTFDHVLKSGTLLSSLHRFYCGIASHTLFVVVVIFIHPTSQHDIIWYWNEWVKEK